jgi:signal transduction histidine kinase
VFYECNGSLDLTYVSSNASDLINVDCGPLIGTRSFWRERVFQEDIDWLAGKLNDCRTSGSTSFVHRLIDDSGLPVWVAHCLRRVTTEEREFFRGCIIPIYGEKRFHDIGHGPVSSFIHKIGNHIQLLTLLISPLKKVLPASREIETLQQTIEKTIELTRAFSDFSQRLNWSSEIDVCDVISSTISAKKAEFAEDRVRFDVAIESAMRGATARGDPCLLESSIGNILQNAWEAITGNGNIIVEGKIENCNGNGSSVVVLRIADTGCGIRQEDLAKVTSPFFTTKKDHDGLGLSMASRFVDLHGGILSVNSWLGKGTEVSITLPVTCDKAGNR